MRHTFIFLFTIIFLINGIGHQANSYVNPVKTTPLDKETISKVLSIANFNNPVMLEEAAYFEGRKFENYQQFGDYYQIQYYPEIPVETFPGVIRLTEHSIGIGETSFNTGSCYKNNDTPCRWNAYNLVNFEPTIPQHLNDQSLKSFIHLGYDGSDDYDDATLAYLLRIIRIPLKDIVTKSHQEFSIRDYDISIDLHDDLETYPIHGPENLYVPRSIRLVPNRSNNRREYSIELSQKTERYSMPITLIVTRLDIEGTKTDIRIIDGPVP